MFHKNNEYSTEKRTKVQIFKKKKKMFASVPNDNTKIDLFDVSMMVIHLEFFYR